MKFQHYDVLIGVRISKEMKGKLEEMSQKARLSEGEIVRDAVDKYFKTLEKFGVNIFPLVANATEEMDGHVKVEKNQESKGGQDVAQERND